jgi:mRNA-degrading endonuclease RelE of RelBE toxin-antitoxin system
LSTCTRPDIAFSVNQASKFNGKATLRHWNQLNKIAAYIKSTKNYGLLYDVKNDEEKVIILDVYTDADWANCVDTRKSISGGIVMLWGCPITWSSKGQTIVATSTCLAEIVSACSGLMDADKSKELLQELNFLKDIESTLFMDNKPAINLIQNNKPPQTMKHLSIKFHSVRDKVKTGEYKIQYCPTNDMLADIFTKSLDKIKFTNLRTKIKVISKNDINKD